MFDILGFALGFGINVKLYSSNRLKVIGFDQNHPFVSVLIGELGYCSLIVTDTKFNENVCAENPYCWATVSSTQEILCKHCKLRYHLFCVGGKDSCGCTSLVYLQIECFNFLIVKIFNCFFLGFKI